MGTEEKEGSRNLFMVYFFYASSIRLYSVEFWHDLVNNKLEVTRREVVLL